MSQVSQGKAGNSPWKRFVRKFSRQRMGMVALVVVVILFLLMLIGPSISPFDPAEPDYNAVMEGPSGSHWMGTDDFGRDIFSRVLNGTRISLAVGLSSVFGGALIGMFFGLTAGYYGGKYDSLVMRACDVLFAFPGILLAIAIIAILGPGLPNVVVAVAVFTIPSIIRIVRGETLALKNKTYIEAARATGLRDREIIWRHIFPGTISVVLVYVTMRIGSAILIAASLSFLGMGAQPPTPEWGAMLSSGRDYLTTAPHVAMFPGLAILVTCLAFNLLGDALRDALDRKLTD
ncbi:ABC transporter permease subunit [Tumebacillus sp. ITR2]|uniref:Glutathione transport system permease protein GsiD n=1 Tax=Tumebacillus amylolyticus TaxID=2801339 RepID=A0ABS1J4M3_9BACL|nr:ABC transporter permease subunit [Tumebacillus amylolyticus]MBL0385224.1 ABC transporter permease subunit [Tumebacillus amylolyticus]